MFCNKGIPLPYNQLYNILSFLFFPDRKRKERISITIISIVIYFLFLLCSKHGYSSSATFLAVGKPASIVAWEVYLFPLIGLAFFIPRA